MSDQDRALLALLGAGVLLAWWSQLPTGIGWPSLAGGGGKRGAQRGQDGPKAPRPTLSPSAGTTGRPGGPGATGDGVIEVTNPRVRVLDLEEYKRLKARAAKRLADDAAKKP